MLLEPAQALRIGDIARHLRTVVNLRDPHLRHGSYRRAGILVSDADDRAAAALEGQRRGADARSRPKRSARAAVRKLAVGISAIILLAAAGSALGGVVCTSARAATGDAILTDERVEVALSFAPAAVFILIVLGLCWMNRGVPYPADDDEIELAPETMPASEAFLQWTPRDADQD